MNSWVFSKRFKNYQNGIIIREDGTKSGAKIDCFLGKQAWQKLQNQVQNAFKGWWGGGGGASKYHNYF